VTTRERNALLVVLAAIAGWVDVLSFTELQRIFTSFQSGNLIFLGLSAGTGDWSWFAGAAVSLAAFVAGSALGAYLIGRSRLDTPSLGALFPALAAEWVLLVAFALAWDLVGRLPLIALAAAAMGAQGAAIFTLRIPGVVTNAMTATLMLAGAVAGLRARGQAGRGESELSVPLLGLLCASYVASAALVALVGASAVVAGVPALALSLVALVATARRSAAVR
jgi:uncharacterized membrane protein YoaK (UPF0700 family)